MEGHEPAERELIKSTFMTKGGWKKASLAEIKAVLTLFDSDKTPPTTAPKTRRCFGLNTAEVDTEELQQRLMAIEAKVTDLKVTGRRLEEESRQRADDLSRNLQEATRSSGPSGSFRCFGCGSPDHPLRFCPQRKDFYGGQRQKKQVQESEGDVRKLMSRLDKMEGEVDSLKEENAKMKKRLNEGQKEGKTNGNPNGGTLPRGTA
jgi:tetrahydromethanopterin S-methyltransferase subunit G